MRTEHQDPLQKYQEQFKEIYSAIKNRRQGCLYAAINHLDPEKSEDICQYFDIDKNSTPENDLKFCEPYLSSPIKDLWILNFSVSEEISKMKVELIKSLDPFKDNAEIFAVIITVAFILAGLYLLTNKSEQSRKSNSNSRRRRRREGIAQPKDNPEAIVAQQPRKPSVLCLVVPSRQLSGLKQGSSIPSSRVEELISSASYFLCDGSVQAIDQTVRLNLSLESINDSSDEDAYIQLKIPEGEEMIDQDTKYSLKKNLPDGVSAEIDKINRLTNLDGLENFICA